MRYVSLILAFVLFAAPAWAARDRAIPSVPLPAVEIYVKIDAMAVLWGFRNKDTGLPPKQGEPGYDRYRERWQTLIQEVFKEIRKRVPANVKLIPATSETQHAGVRVDMTVADIATSCSSNEYYKYLWVRTYQDDGTSTNWDGLGVRSSTLVRRGMDDRERVTADVDAWVQLWAQVPYLHAWREATPVHPIVEPDTDESAAR